MELRQLPLVLLLISNIHSQQTKDIPKPTLTVEPQSSLFTGDSVTLRCEVNQSWDRWEFIRSRDSNTESTEAATKTINSVTVSDGGEYRCRAQRRGLYTNYSEPVTVTINERPKAKVSIKPDQHVFREERVTLRCDIDGEGVTSWKYSWYKDGSDSVFSELQEHTFSSVTESDAGKYSCYGAERGGSRTSNISDEVTLTVSDKTRPVLSVSPPVSLIISPNRTQHFTLISLSLSCEDQRNSDRWTVRRYKDNWGLEDCLLSRWGSQKGSTCKIMSTDPSYTGVYWCQSESGDSYQPVNITVHLGVILESPVHPVTEGDSLTLRCLYKHSTPPILRADFYKDGSLIQNQTTEMIISTVSKSHEGLYYCKHPERGESPKSWISVTASSTTSESDGLNPMIIGVTAGLILTFLIIVFLVLLWRYRNNKGVRSQSPSRVSEQQNSSQTSEQNQSQAGYNTLLSGTAHIYDSVDATINKDFSTDSVSGPTDVTYAEIEHESSGKQKKNKENKEKTSEVSDTVYSKLNLGTHQGAGSSDVTYTQVK
uniref:Leukocyte immune-type receptor LITR4.1 n=1 Tax=Carassius auratus TaxID=7957 RepID=A0A892A3L6_CARAU|nr:leukocyte immune-type receptor LITR4.1 [Carassius auratus]